MTKSIPVFTIKWCKNHTLWGSTYLYGLNKGFPPPTQDLKPARLWLTSMIMRNILEANFILTIFTSLHHLQMRVSQRRGRGLHKLFLQGLLHRLLQSFEYSQTSLIRTPKGQSKVSILERCPYKRGHYNDVTFMTPLTVKSVLQLKPGSHSSLNCI